ncbi:hypothetical protein EF847_16865 [Actinobacteria bacterium YIM 96077]|uniref:Carbon monoxide dehydrogenase n=1 Tax=Phytoactinopolyspora halophila TaxID=1981511 RepID=A0A329QE21_9ACTN|nr:SRPBCC family protein [Phytoactinopolyspora halophila]AYY14125.1 hypothetical protein EF847_16865 [Actinobacteria bacterium YIM 96077]RAW09939.1 hypothetical protein DPM12_19850 [Phytoactinopolyspora halophila]
MQLEHQFTVPTPVDQAWQVLLDVPGIAPCMPGATLTEFDGTEFAGSVKVKLGPISLLYRGTGHFAEKDEAARRIVIEASGKESRGSGTAAATVIAVLVGDGDKTRVDVTTDLKITGRPAQFGRGMISDVGAKLLGQFAECLERKVGEPAVPEQAAPAESAGAATQTTTTGTTTSGAATSSTTTSSTTTSGTASAAGAATTPAPSETEAIDLFEVSGARDAARKYGPLAAATAAVTAVLWFALRRRRRH